jgi:hypothetical protein
MDQSQQQETMQVAAVSCTPHAAASWEPPSTSFKSTSLSSPISRLIGKALSIVDKSLLANRGSGEHDDDTESTDELTMSDHSNCSFASSYDEDDAAAALACVAPQHDDDECEGDYPERHCDQQEQDEAIDQSYYSRRRNFYRRVQFDFEATHVIESDLDGGLTAEDIDNGWYSAIEWESMYAVYDHELSEGELAVQWQEDLVEVVAMCNRQAGCVPGKRAIERAVICLAEPDAAAQRGFEAEFIPHLVECRDIHRHHVLEFAERMQQKNLSQDLKDRLIASRSIQFSQTHSMFAQILGQVDELASLDDDDEDFEGLF